jgi:hypothetical protein
MADMLYVAPGETVTLSSVGPWPNLVLTSRREGLPQTLEEEDDDYDRMIAANLAELDGPTEEAFNPAAVWTTWEWVPGTGFVARRRT